MVEQLEHLEQTRVYNLGTRRPYGSCSTSYSYRYIALAKENDLFTYQL